MLLPGTIVVRLVSCSLAVYLFIESSHRNPVARKQAVQSILTQDPTHGPEHTFSVIRATTRLYIYL